VQQVFVGPNSPNPDAQIYRDDFNNFGPAVGFALQLSCLGKGKTTLRGGCQVTYKPVGRADNFAGVIANTIGTNYTNVHSGDSSAPYLDITSLPSIVPAPIPANSVPLQVIPLTGTYTRSRQLGLQGPYADPMCSGRVCTRTAFF
jgi:hypothetical protein